MSLLAGSGGAGETGRRTVDDTRVPTLAERVDSLSRDPRCLVFLAIERLVAPTGA